MAVRVDISSYYDYDDDLCLERLLALRAEQCTIVCIKKEHTGNLRGSYNPVFQLGIEITQPAFLQIHYPEWNRMRITIILFSFG